MIKSIEEIDLSPKPGKDYWKNCHREWREEFIYFLLVDRFHDSHQRKPSPARNRKGFGDKNQLQNFCGGTIRGITHHLDYIQNLGCTAIWLSPVFESTAYHGYAIENYLNIDKRFGTKEDLEALVDAAHSRDMRVFLDIVLHHSADTWCYPGNVDYYYYNGTIFPFGAWRSDERPLPVELRNPDLYWRKGQIRHFDNYPETRDGDFLSLKTFKNDNSPEGIYLQDLLTKIHCYWIREVDIDGFRLDAVKHIGEEVISRFCSHIREYAYKLGKRNFFLFGELVGPDELYNRYIGPKTSTQVEDKAVYYGLNSVLDFPLYHVLADVIQGKSSSKGLIDRYESLRLNAMHRGEFGEFLVTFIDNHDQVGQPIKHRLGHDSTESQVIAGIGFLLCALGTPCIYYGTEQGFSGADENDWAIRECMFNLNDRTTNLFNEDERIYKEISCLADLRKSSPVLKFGRMYMREISHDGKIFRLPDFESTLAFSRVLYDQEFIIAFNRSTTQESEDYIEVDAHLNREGSLFRFIYGHHGKIRVLKSEDSQRSFVKLKLLPSQFVILSNEQTD